MHGTSVTLTALVVLALGLIACNNASAGRYPEEVRNNYLQACTEKGTTIVDCKCTLRGLEQRLSHEEFMKLDEAIRNGDQDARQRLQGMMQEIGKECSG